ncbi:MAG: tetratricopeptide repeat protein [Pirellulales bacterium]|nr:tetratricopeptide repeat protein [Pirellulales bacterium]
MYKPLPWIIALVSAVLLGTVSSPLHAQTTSGESSWFGGNKSGATSGSSSYGLKRKSPWKRFTDGVSSTWTRGTGAVKGAFIKETGPIDETSLSNTPAKASNDLNVATARLKATNGRSAEAETIYRQVLEDDPEHLGALLGLARLMDHYGKTDEAIELYRFAVNVHPKEASAHNDLGLCYGRHRRFEEAARQLEIAVKIQPDKELYRNNLASVLVAQGRKNEALKHMLAVHSPAVAHYNVGFLLGQSGDIRGGIEEIDQALQLDPNMKEARQQRGLLLARLPGPVGEHYLVRQQQGQAQVQPQFEVARRPEPYTTSPTVNPPTAAGPMTSPMPAVMPPAATAPTEPQVPGAGNAYPPSRY